ncbi:hypothetical protein BC629DRAFT_1463287 [Irpex lacteus]|nr:hypothetical protein BC629DRAFT_1463287 [Irpex lacteus]
MPRCKLDSCPSAVPSTRSGPVTGRDGPYLGQRRGTVAHRIFGRGHRLAGRGHDISGDELKSLVALMRAKAFAHLDRALPLGQQNPARLARYIEECSSLRGLQRYRDGLRCWPAKIYAKIYLSRTSTRLQRSNFNNSQPEAEPDEPVAVPAQTPMPSQSSSGSSGAVGTGSSLQIYSDDLDSTDQTIFFGSSQEQRRESKSPVRSPSDGSSSSQAADANSAPTSATHSIALASAPSSVSSPVLSVYNPLKRRTGRGRFGGARICVTDAPATTSVIPSSARRRCRDHQPSRVLGSRDISC